MRGYIDKLDNTILAVREDEFIARLRLSHEIGNAFQQKYTDDIKHLNDLANEIHLLLIFCHKRSASFDELHSAFLGILSNAFNTYLSGIIMLQSGFPLQEGILYRSFLESISSVIYLFFNSNKLEDFSEGRIKSYATISFAKQLIPAFGKIYGEFSDNFAHIGKPHHVLIPVIDFRKCIVDPQPVFYYAKNMLWLLDIVSELVFYDFSQRRYYWKRIEGEAYEFTPYPETLATWRKTFFGCDKQELSTARIDASNAGNRSGNV